uniref:Metalloendopeptidase n=1 Tax=Knipowitschia caucasica TaxID=637954 RepID=A0AAV2KYW6_KNICA
MVGACRCSSHSAPPARPDDVIDDVTDDNESVSDIIAKANKDIESAMTEGDVKSDGRRNALHCSSCKWPKYGKYVSIYYHFSNKYSECWSYIGRVLYYRRQSLSLSSACLTTATVQHELFHALGFTHEHSRSDRDDHVTVHYENILPDKKHNFKKYRTNNLYTPYDFDSVMQYQNWAWTSNREMTLTSKENPKLMLGIAKSASDNDFLRVNRYYKCPV